MIWAYCFWSSTAGTPLVLNILVTNRCSVVLYCFYTIHYYYPPPPASLLGLILPFCLCHTHTCIYIYHVLISKLNRYNGCTIYHHLTLVTKRAVVTERAATVTLFGFLSFRCCNQTLDFGHSHWNYLNTGSGSLGKELTPLITITLT